MTGEMKKSIKVRKGKNLSEVEVFSDSQYFIYHEYGTSRMPPRPIFGIALERKREEAGKIVGDHLFTERTKEIKEIED